MAAVEAAWWLNDRMHAWLRERNVADTLTRSVPHNVTSEMNELPRIAGGREARDAIRDWLDKYGMRAVVGVEHATRLIRDGRRILVDGTDGHVEILAP